MVALAQKTGTGDWWNKVTFGTLRYADGCPCPVDCDWRLVEEGNLWNTKVRRWLPGKGCDCRSMNQGNLWNAKERRWLPSILDWSAKVAFGTLRYADGICPTREVTHTGLVDHSKFLRKKKKTINSEPPPSCGRLP